MVADKMKTPKWMMTKRIGGTEPIIPTKETVKMSAINKSGQMDVKLILMAKLLICLSRSSELMTLFPFFLRKIKEQNSSTPKIKATALVKPKIHGNV